MTYHPQHSLSRVDTPDPLLGSPRPAASDFFKILLSQCVEKTSEIYRFDKFINSSKTSENMETMFFYLTGNHREWLNFTQLEIKFWNIVAIICHLTLSGYPRLKLYDTKTNI